MPSPWLKLIALICALSATSADLLDLYVEHMDETMKTDTFYRKRHDDRRHDHSLAKRSSRFTRRLPRSVLESSVYRLSDPVKQSLEINGRRRGRAGKKRISMINDDLDFTNIRDDELITNEDAYNVALRHTTTTKKPYKKIGDKTSGVEHLSSYKRATAEKMTIDITKKYHHKKKTAKKTYAGQMSVMEKRAKRSEKANANDNGNNVEFTVLDVGRKFTRHEILDVDGDVILEWDHKDGENVTFRVSARTKGYVGVGFNERGSMKGADMVIAWVDDRSLEPRLVDSHGLEDANAAPKTDTSQDYHLLHGTQNDTHTVVTFTRRWQTCDSQDRSLTGDTTHVLWALHHADPEYDAAMFHGAKRGARALRLKAAAPHPPPVSGDPHLVKWDVKLSQFTVSNNTDTVYWCKIFKAPRFERKHHMIGYTPLIEKANEPVVHHIILYECASTQPILAEHARLAGAHCYSPTMPKEWDSCLQPVLSWARGSSGEWLPDHVGLPIAEHSENSYYMLEVHYNNRIAREVVDSSGIRLHLTPNLRKMEAGILLVGVAVSPFHMVPPEQKEYATAGYCASDCTDKMFDKDGINVVSVVLHSHLAGRRLSLKHVRQGKELPPIVQDNQFDFEYQQTHTLDREVPVLPGDELVAECVYDTRGRSKATFGGYAASQEMCLAFVMHYPRTPLAACYSMTPVKEFFEALNVQGFKGVTMEQVEKLFLSTTTEAVKVPVSPTLYSKTYPGRLSEDNDADIIRQAKSALISKGDYIDYDDIFARLVIEKPEEFKDHTLSDHIAALAWNDTALSKSIETSLYHGKHSTFCRTREDKIPQNAVIRTFPNFTALPVSNDTHCKHFRRLHRSSGLKIATSFVAILLPLLMALCF